VLGHFEAQVGRCLRVFIGELGSGGNLQWSVPANQSTAESTWSGYMIQSTTGTTSNRTKSGFVHESLPRDAPRCIMCLILTAFLPRPRSGRLLPGYNSRPGRVHLLSNISFRAPRQNAITGCGSKICIMRFRGRSALMVTRGMFLQATSRGAPTHRRAGQFTNLKAAWLYL
jgi:hypothetical protein